MIRDEITKHMFLMIQDEITYVREKWGHFEGNCGGAIPKSSCRTRLVFMTITNTTMRTRQGQGEFCVSVYCRLRKQMMSSRTSRLLRSRRLSASHKGRFKGSHLPILCKIQLLEFHLNFVYYDRSLFMWGIVGKLVGKNDF